MIDRDPDPVGRERLVELIAALGELRNAGPRDRRFRQWRQVTTTALQRIWPSEPARAEGFRRILFSGPTAFANPSATLEHFERGCREATAYLEGLVRTLSEEAPPATASDAPRGPAAKLPQPGPRAADPSTPQAGRAAAHDPPSVREPSRPAAPSSAAPSPAKPTPLARSRPIPPKLAPPAGRTIKDMLGFTDQPEPPAAPLPTPPPPPPPAPEETTSWEPSYFAPLVLEPKRAAPPPPPPPPPAPLAPRSPEPPPSPVASQEPDWARELLVLAAGVQGLGVPARQCGIVRAALVDLGCQMAAPPIRWEALRATVTLTMEYPALARRLLPLILPHLDRAA